jgi:hypothetical protein
MSQSKRGSLIETCINIGVGFSINFTANMLILPLFGWQVSAGQAFNLGLIFTIIAIARGYYIRRLFNWLHVHGKLV